MDEKAEILRQLQPLFEQARREGKWFHTFYQDIWLSPDELEAAHKKGRFLWGPCNWTLRDPKELVAEAESEANCAMRALAAAKQRTGT